MLYLHVGWEEEEERRGGCDRHEHLGRSVWGGGHRRWRCGGAAGRWGLWESTKPTQLMAEGVRAEIRGLQHVGPASVESRAEPRLSK